MSTSLSPTLLAICGAGSFVDALRDYFSDNADYIEGEFYKHDMCFGQLVLSIEPHVVEEFPFLDPYLGGQLIQNGTSSYNYGWDSYDNVELFVSSVTTSKQEVEFDALLSHLNAEENEMAQEFKAKWFTPVETLTKVE